MPRTLDTTHDEPRGARPAVQARENLRPDLKAALMLQRTAGNRATSRLLDARAVGGGVEGGELVDNRSGAPATPTVQRDSPEDVTVAFGGQVRSASTPAGMVDRIAPGRSVPLAFTVANWHTPMAPITLSVANVGAGGVATVNGGATAQVQASGTVTVAGTDQTAVGQGAQLRVTATLGRRVVAQSAPFAVCAVPTDWTDTLIGPVTGARRGIEVQDGWSSDGGGGLADLAETEISEQVQYSGGTGCFAGINRGTNSGYLPGHQLTTDTHAIATSALTGVGHLVADQVSTFNEKRTGATDVPMANSGMRVTRDVRAKSGGGFEIETSKNGAATTARGFTSAAGTAAISLRQDV
ncbi:hypothetical protein JOD54_004467 [Actinokineospora baliensis]|uniref:hypothetical protein n=1 Tax=Actinokineospora baliensis TaxID=547056 RepID=UPI0019575F53|nr:hypothetical protein [Actinokineospora baliensis]MBM7774263.1 hypothetical protein [Actinokineospora baliensis]